MKNTSLAGKTLIGFSGILLASAAFIGFGASANASSVVRTDQGSHESCDSHQSGDSQGTDRIVVTTGGQSDDCNSECNDSDNNSDGNSESSSTEGGDRLLRNGDSDQNHDGDKCETTSSEPSSSSSEPASSSSVAPSTEAPTTQAATTQAPTTAAVTTQAASTAPATVLEVSVEKVSSAKTLASTGIQVGTLLLLAVGLMIAGMAMLFSSRLVKVAVK